MLPSLMTTLTAALLDSSNVLYLPLCCPSATGFVSLVMIPSENIQRFDVLMNY